MEVPASAQLMIVLAAIGLLIAVLAAWSVRGRRRSEQRTLNAIHGQVLGSAFQAHDIHGDVNVHMRPAGTDHDAPTFPPWNVPARSRAFTGRDGALISLREQLLLHGTTAVLALHGLGGVGKTALAVEYAHRHADDYTIVWWIDAEQPGLVSDQLAELGVTAGWLGPVLDVTVAARAVLGRLHSRNDWLIVFDNCESPDDVVRWLPQGRGHVIITSRNPNWRQVAEPVEVDVFDRAESVALLRLLVPGLSPAEADLIADGLGDLPLAVAQAAGVLAETGMTSDEYLRVLASNTTRMLTEGKPPSYPVALAAAVRVSMDRLEASDPAGVELLRLLSTFAPEPVPPAFLTSARNEDLSAALATAVSSPLTLRRTLGRVSCYGLAKIHSTGLQLHRLVRAIILDQLTENELRVVRARAERVLVASRPRDSRDPRSWQQWFQLVPHLLAVDPAVSDDPAFRSLAGEAGWYLLQRGDLMAAKDFAEHLHRHWKQRLGADDPDTLCAAYTVASVVWRLGRREEALAIAQDVHTRRLAVCGPNHRHTSNSADQVASLLCQLGDPAAARSLHEDALRRLKKEYGEDNRLALGVAHNLALDLYELGLFEEALTLNGHVFDRRRTVLGPDHPHTLLSAKDLSRDLHQAGHRAEALELATSTAARCREVLGADHPDTLNSASHLAMLLHEENRFDEALELREDVLRRTSQVFGPQHAKTTRAAADVETSTPPLTRNRAPAASPPDQARTETSSSG